MKQIFTPGTERVFFFLIRLPGLSAEQVDQVVQAWKQAPWEARAEALAKAHQVSGEQERNRILVAASVARRTARDTAHRLNRSDWAFWAAAADAATAIAAGHRIGVHYSKLIAPLTAVMPSLSEPGVLSRGDAGDGSRRQPEPLRRGA